MSTTEFVISLGRGLWDVGLIKEKDDGTRQEHTQFIGWHLHIVALDRKTSQAGDPLEAARDHHPEGRKARESPGREASDSGLL